MLMYLKADAAGYTMTFEADEVNLWLDRNMPHFQSMPQVQALRNRQIYIIVDRVGLYSVQFDGVDVKHPDLPLLARLVHDFQPPICQHYWPACKG